MTISIINTQTGKCIGQKLVKFSPTVTTTNNLKVNAGVRIALSDILMSDPSKQLIKSTQSDWFVIEADSS